VTSLFIPLLTCDRRRTEKEILVQSIIEEVQGVIVFRPVERTVDQSNASTFLAPLAGYTSENHKIVIDLSETSFLSSAGLGAIVMLIRDVRSAGGQVYLCAPTPTVKALFKLVRIDNITRIFETRTAAVNDMSGTS
jgi:anti-sigma B factor antagonist